MHSNALCMLCMECNGIWSMTRCYALLNLDKMAWSKIRKRQKGMCRIEIGWWYYKIKCEIGYHLFGSTSKMYNKNLDKMLSKYNRNLYGQNMHEV